MAVVISGRDHRKEERKIKKENDIDMKINCHNALRVSLYSYFCLNIKLH